MIKFHRMLMIGSAGPNVGKTELACALIRRFSRRAHIVGIKVTTIAAKDGRCPRGGQGCGVCTSLEGDFCITEETNSYSHKDTSRLLAAGASRVFWMRAMYTHLREGLAALLDRTGHDASLICESNALRRVVEPGLFLIVKNSGSRKWKRRAQDVRKYADAIVVSDGSSFDLDIERIKLVGGRWLLQEKATVIILAGGESCRMGADKSMLPIGGQPMIARICEQLRGTFSQILISSNEADRYSFLGCEIVPDKVPGQGPLMGIASALEASANEVNFVVACDIADINLPYVRRMLAEANGADLVIPTTRDEKYEPLFAVYRKSALDAVNKVLAAGRHKISDVFPLCKVKHIELSDADWLSNINTMSEYEQFLKSCGAQT
jgi:molybdopterin-guanine dinucleotide biosynthesis protein A